MCDRNAEDESFLSLMDMYFRHIVDRNGQVTYSLYTHSCLLQYRLDMSRPSLFFIIQIPLLRLVVDLLSAATRRTDALSRLLC